MRAIFFDIDCLRPDHLGCYGYNRPTSPNIDTVAKQGVRFDRYYCADSPCLPSRMNWSSGRFGIRNGVVSNTGVGAKFHIRTRNYQGPIPDNDMLMRQLRKKPAGVQPVSFSNFADRHNMFWFECGWAEFHTPNLKGGGENADEIHEPLMQWLKCNAKREDYLLHINYWDAHRLYKMDASWADRFKDYPVTQPWPDEDAIKRHQSINGPFTAQAQFKDGKSVVPLMPDSISSRKDFEHMITGYDAAIAYVDHHLGSRRLIRRTRRLLRPRERRREHPPHPARHQVARPSCFDGAQHGSGCDGEGARVRLDALQRRSQPDPLRALWGRGAGGLGWRLVRAPGAG